MTTVSYLIVPIILAIVSLLILFSKKGLFDAFLRGARSGFDSAVRLLPTLVILLAAVSMLTASGAAEFIADRLAVPLSKIGVPSEIVSLIIMRPISGSASTALLSDLFEREGADSFAGLCASMIAGSSDTIVYIFALYFGAARVKRTRHAFLAAILTMLVTVFVACSVVRILF